MPTINQLSAVDQINDGDQFPLYSPNAGDARKASFTTVKESLADDFASLADLAAQTGAGLVGTSNGTTVQQALDSKPTATLDTDGTLAANSDGRVASQKATKTYADAKSTALAASGGSALVGHIAAGAGATARTVQSKLRDFVSVKDFGAVGDGVTNDTAAIQAAIDYVASLGGGQVFFPPVTGYYLVTGLALKQGVTLTSGMTAYGYAAGPVDTVRIGSNTAGWVIDTPATAITSVGIIGLTITGPGAGTATGGVRFRNVSWSTVTYCNFNNFENQGFLHVSGLAVTISYCLTTNCLLDRTRAAPAGSIELQSGTTDDWLLGIEANTSLGGVTDANLYCRAILIDGANHFVTDCIGEFSDIGISVVGDFCRFSGCRADLNWGHGFFINNDTGFASKNQFSNCLALNNSQGTSNTYDGFHATAKSNNNAFSNCISEGGQHRYGFADLSNGTSVKNNYVNPRSYLAVSGAFNFVNDGPELLFPSGPLNLLAVNSTTPSVNQYLNWYSINSSATTITNFTNGVNGQQITLACFDSNTTIQHNGATIVLPGSVNMKLVSGFFYKFLRHNGVWYFAGSSHRPGAFVADPAGGATVDAESRTAIAAIIDSLIAAGVMLPS